MAFLQYSCIVFIIKNGGVIKINVKKIIVSIISLLVFFILLYFYLTLLIFEIKSGDFFFAIVISVVFLIFALSIFAAYLNLIDEKPKVYGNFKDTTDEVVSQIVSYDKGFSINIFTSYIKNLFALLDRAQYSHNLAGVVDSVSEKILNQVQTTGFSNIKYDSIGMCEYTYINKMYLLKYERTNTFEEITLYLNVWQAVKGYKFLYQDRIKHTNAHYVLQLTRQGYMKKVSHYSNWFLADIRQLT